jgi:hypothetical protein
MNNSKIQGKLYTIEEIKKVFEDHGFSVSVDPLTNGAILYGGAPY